MTIICYLVFITSKVNYNSMTFTGFFHASGYTTSAIHILLSTVHTAIVSTKWLTAHEGTLSVL